jgi:hypothetical protein
MLAAARAANSGIGLQDHACARGGTIDPIILINTFLQFGLQQLGRLIGVSGPEVPDLTGPDGLGGELRAHFLSMSSLKAQISGNRLSTGL